MQAIDILGRIDGGNHAITVDLFRQRHLDKDAIHCRIGVQGGHQGEQIGLACIGRQAILARDHPGFARGLALGADIDRAGRIIANQHDGEPRCAAMGGHECGHTSRHFGAQGGGAGLAVNQHSTHCSSLVESSTSAGTSICRPRSSSHSTSGDRSMPPKSGRMRRMGRTIGP